MRPSSQFERGEVSSLLDDVGLFYSFASVNGSVQEVVNTSHSEVGETTGQMCGFESLRTTRLTQIPRGGEISQRGSSERRAVDLGGPEWLRGGRREDHGGNRESLAGLERTHSGEYCYRVKDSENKNRIIRVLFLFERASEHEHGRGAEEREKQTPH